MPKQLLPSEFDAILAIITRSSHGASIEDILKKLAFSLPRRSLQRRLAFLVKARRLDVSGRGKATRYKLSPPNTPFYYEPTQPGINTLRVKETPRTEETYEIYAPISSAGQEIKQSVRRFIHERQPVSYHREFLDAYIPNITQYLPESIRQDLYQIGHVPDGKKPAGTYARHIFNRLLIDLSWNSSRLEGNTYSLLETERPA